MKFNYKIMTPNTVRSDPLLHCPKSSKTQFSPFDASIVLIQRSISAILCCQKKTVLMKDLNVIQDLTNRTNSYRVQTKNCSYYITLPFIYILYYTLLYVHLDNASCHHNRLFDLGIQFYICTCITSSTTLQRYNVII